MNNTEKSHGKLYTFFAQFFSVFSFTIVQALKGKKYLKLTIGIMFLLIGITLFGSVIFVYMEHNNKEEKNISIEKVWLEKGILEKDFLEGKKNKQYHKIEVEEVSDVGDVGAKQLGKQDILIQLQEKQETYYINGILSEDSQISEEEANTLLVVVKECFYQEQVKKGGLDSLQLELLNKEKVGNIYIAGDSEYGIEWVLKVSVPVFVGIFIYMIIVMYGQNIMLEVSSEKTSKLMETMLVNVYPEALVFGKILGTALLGIMQVLLWIGGLIYGLVLGVLLGSKFFPAESESYGKVVEVTQSYGVDMNVTSGLLMAILIIGLGILLYCFFAGIPGSLIAKPEHAGNVQQLVQIPLAICFIATYFAVFMEKKELLVFLRYFPFTAPFVLPGELIMGTSSVVVGGVVSIIIFVAVVLLGIISGKIYKYKALHSGK